MEMHSEELRRQLTIGGDMFQGGILDNFLSTWTTLPVEILPQATSLTNPNSTKGNQKSQQNKLTTTLDLHDDDLLIKPLINLINNTQDSID